MPTVPLAEMFGYATELALDATQGTRVYLQWNSTTTQRVAESVANENSRRRKKLTYIYSKNAVDMRSIGDNHGLRRSSSEQSRI